MKKKKPDPGLIDDENPEWTEQMFREAKPFKEVFPDLYASWKRGRGRPKKANRKREVKLRIDPDVLENFKARGKGWQTRMHAVLRDWADRHPVG